MLIDRCTTPGGELQQCSCGRGPAHSALAGMRLVAAGQSDGAPAPATPLWSRVAKRTVYAAEL